VSDLRAELSTLSAQHRNLDEIFESYRKRDAQRVSTSVRRAKKEEEEEPETPPIPKAIDKAIQDAFAWKGGNGIR
jgi:ribosomal 50S subunit-associated protein YjgA (DUF615 family)